MDEVAAVSAHARTLTACIMAVAATGGVTATMVAQQHEADAHVAAARQAAGADHAGFFSEICAESQLRLQQSTPGAASPARRARQGQAPPSRETWYAEPVKVFDNLYFVGQSEYSAWAVTTSEGIVLIDTIFDYSVEIEVAGGLKKLGLDPKTIRYAIVSHGHADHHGGARYLQETFGTRLVMGGPDWELVERDTRTPAPKRDLVATDGQKLTLGDTTLTLFLTPGHTLGTVSTIVPVKDNGRPHVAALWGGTLFNFPRTRERFATYISSAERFRGLAEKSGADVLISNHTDFDGTKVKAPALALRRPGQPHPYVIGKDGVSRYMTIAAECARAALINLDVKP
jgi:metallo-beta-lactamase class B